MVERIGVLGKLFSRKPQEVVQEIPHISPVKQERGCFQVSGITAIEWLATPFQFNNYSDLGALLAQVFEEGYGIRETDQVRLSWRRCIAFSTMRTTSRACISLVFRLPARFVRVCRVKKAFWTLTSLWWSAVGLGNPAYPCLLPRESLAR